MYTENICLKSKYVIMLMSIWQLYFPFFHLMSSSFLLFIWVFLHQLSVPCLAFLKIFFYNAWTDSCCQLHTAKFLGGEGELKEGREPSLDVMLLILLSEADIFSRTAELWSLEIIYNSGRIPDFIWRLAILEQINSLAYSKTALV